MKLTTIQSEAKKFILNNDRTVINGEARGGKSTIILDIAYEWKMDLLDDYIDSPTIFVVSDQPHWMYHRFNLLAFDDNDIRHKPARVWIPPKSVSFVDREQSLPFLVNRDCVVFVDGCDISSRLWKELEDTRVKKICIMTCDRMEIDSALGFVEHHMPPIDVMDHFESEYQRILTK